MDFTEDFPGTILVVEGVAYHLDGNFVAIAFVSRTDHLPETAFSTYFQQLIVDLRMPPNLGQLRDFTPFVLEEAGPVRVVGAGLAKRLKLRCRLVRN